MSFWSDHVTDEEIEKAMNPTPWRRFLIVLTVPFVWALYILHFFVCVILMILIHPEYRCYNYYEYYSRWGWGRRPERPKEPDQ